MILNGTQLAEQASIPLQAECFALLERFGRAPSLHVVLVGDNPASALYVSMKTKRAQKIGILTEVHRFPEDVSLHVLLSTIQKLNQDLAVDGILVQLPLPDRMQTRTVLNAIDLTKDVDGLTSTNLGFLMQNEPYLTPCTPLGCMQLLNLWKQDISGLNAVIVGRSTLVGLPLSLLLTQANATVSLCHSKTTDLSAHTSRADILIAACGSPLLLKEEHVKEGACVIDVGINRLADGTLVGDVDFGAVQHKVSAITPVPGGVGPMTVFNLLANTVRAMTKRLII